MSLNIKRCLFTCGSEYTTLNCVNVRLNKLQNEYQVFDIAIFERTEVMRDIANNIKKAGIFKNVYSYFFINRLNIFSLGVLFLFPLLMLNNLFNRNNSKRIKKDSYDIIISQNIIYALIFLRINKNADVYLIEEGLSSYTGRVSNFGNRSKIFKLFFKFIFKKEFKNLISKQYLYNPEINLSEKNDTCRIPKNSFLDNKNI